MDNINEPVKPAEEETQQHTLVLDIGSNSYVLDPQITVETAVKLMRVLALGCRKRGQDYNSATQTFEATVGPREIIALQLVPVAPAESEVTK